MAGQRKEFIADKTLLTWLMASAFATIGCMLVTAVIIYMIYDCWIMCQHQLAGGSCGPDVNIPLVIAIPIVFGLVIGTVLTRKTIKDEVPGE